MSISNFCCIHNGKQSTVLGTLLDGSYFSFKDSWNCFDVKRIQAYNNLKN